MATRTERANADALAAWATHLRAERHASPHTSRAYLSDVRQLLEASGVAAPAAVRADTIRHWLRGLDGAADRASIARKLAAVRGFFRFLVDTGRVRRDPTLGIATPPASAWASWSAWIGSASTPTPRRCASSARAGRSASSR
jgi:integrase/recombinase XerC